MLDQKVVFFCISFFAVHFIYAQHYKIEGHVSNKNNQPLPYVNLILLAKDSTAISGTSTEENGTFIMSQISKGSYILQTSYVGYKNTYSPVEVNANVQIGNLVMLENVENLDGVTVIHQRPRIEKKGGKLIFQVENSTLSSMSGYEILKRTPTVIIVNDNISIKNSKTTVYINNKRVYLNDMELKNLLENFSGTNIASVEVITNPSSKYDAEGGAVLNIVTSKNISIGYKGSINGNYEQGIFPKYRFGTDHYYKSSFVNLYAGYTFNPRKDYKRSDSYTNFFNGNLPGNQWKTSLYKTTRSKAHNLNTIVNFDLDTKNTLSITSNFNFSPEKTIDNLVDTHIFDADENPNGAFISTSDIENDNVNLSFNATYNREMGNGTTLSAQANYVYYNDEQFQDILTDYYNENNAYEYSNIFGTHWTQQNNIFTGQVDISAIWNENNIDFGTKYSGIKGNSEMIFFGDYMPEQANNDDFDYDETIWAGYVNLNREWEKWALELGLRGEYTNAIGNSAAYGEVNHQDYFGLFPTISIHNTISDTHEWGISYKRAIDRPRYQSLNPFRYYLNENNFIAGNPTLTPSTENKVTLDYTYKGNYIFSLYYQHENNDLGSLTFQNNEDEITYNAVFNLDESFQYSIDLVHYRYLTKWWYLSTYLSEFYYELSFLARESNNQKQTMNTFGFFGQVYNSFTLSKNRTWSASLYLEYLSRFLAGNYIMKDRFKANIGIRKKLGDGRAEITLNANDIFNTFNIPFTTKYLNQDNGYLPKPETRTVSVGFKYNFGNYRLKDNKREIDFKEEERLNEEEIF
ncbi:outer membrane beta-barrel protein [Galbibacter sp. PAP.153]|uniref:outer membrane beta-barrel protein n=1 Tax=Galbibacter sp. PAP.153 TaxID=3104623 RepID=UPI003009482B